MANLGQLVRSKSFLDFDEAGLADAGALWVDLDADGGVAGVAESDGRFEGRARTAAGIAGSVVPTPC